MDLAELRSHVEQGRIDTVICAFPDLYGRLLGKRLDARFFVDASAAGTHVCDYLLTVDMEMEPVAGYTFANWEKGYGDLHLVPDLATLRLAAWLDATAIVLCDAETRAHEPVAVAPRSVLRGQVARARAAGFDVLAASELEYHVYRTSYADAADAGYADLRPAGWYVEDYHLLQGARTEDLNGAFRRHLTASGIPVESTKGEWGRGQHEVNIRFADALDMADRHVLLKQCLKETADRAGASVTFMAKVDEGGAGSSSHLHVSLWRDGVNAFAPAGGRAGGGTGGGTGGGVGGDGGGLAEVACSDTFRWFLGGWMAHAGELAACYAPTVNSYKRFQPQSWAPTAVAWGPDNRTAGFRVVGEGPSLRIECRLPGADVNPYIAYAAVIASGLAGIEGRIEPPEPVAGDAYEASNRPSPGAGDALPADLPEAADRLAKSELARSAFGTDVLDHYVHFLRTEAAAFGRAVTDWERRRYFERI